MTTRLLFQPLQRLLQEYRPALSSAPVLVITSKPNDEHDDGASPEILQARAKTIGHTCNLVPFLLAQQMGLRTVRSYIDSPLPTIKDVEERLTILERVGAASVVAVGSGAAMDLAKALGEQGGVENIVLVPATHGAALAAGSSRGLLLDPSEPTLMPSPKVKGTADVVVVAPETALSGSASDAAYACSAVAMAELLRDPRDPKAVDLLARASAALVDGDEANVMQMLFDSGSMLEYGLGNHERSATLALASSLVPTLYPGTPPVSFIRSLVPGLAEALLDASPPVVDQDDDPLLKATHQLLRDSSDGAIPKLGPSEELEGLSLDDEARSHIHANQALWKCIDYPDALLLDILRRSV